MSLEEKVGQLFFVRVPETEALTDVSTYHLGGYILFSRDMKDAAGTWLTAEQLSGNISGWQDAAAADTGIPMRVTCAPRSSRAVTRPRTTTASRAERPGVR